MLTADDKLELLQVQYLYGHVLDAFLWDKLDEVFANNGVFDPSNVGLPVMRGLDEIREKLIPLEEGPDKDRLHVHAATNPAIIDIVDENNVKMRTKYIVVGEGDYTSWGEYEDDMVRTDRGWRISYRKTKRVSAYQTPFLAEPPTFEGR